MDEKRAMNIFISSTSKDLAEYRQAVYETVEKMKGWHGVPMENFGAWNRGAEELCVKAVRDCQLFIGILGMYYGESPQGKDKSYTELEYDTASSINMPRLMFLTPEDFYSPPQTEEQRQKQLAFRKRVSGERVYAAFSDPPSLALEVAIAIRNWERDQALKKGLPYAIPYPPYHNLPRDVHPFFGREDEMNYLERKLVPGKAIAFCGSGGIGKTALAIRAAYRFRERFPEGVIWLDLTYTTAEDALSAIARAYDLKPDPDKVGETLRGFLHDKKALLILDDAQSPEQVSEIIKYAGTCATLITSRLRKVAAVGDLWDTKPLDEGPALELLAHNREKPFAAGELETAKEICKKLAYLPLALSLAGSYMKVYGVSLHDYLELFEAMPGDALHLADNKEWSVWASFDLSYRKLSQEDQRAFAILSWHRGDFSLEAAMAGLGEENRIKAMQTLHRLRGLSLLEDGEGRYRYHTLLRIYAQEKEAEGREEAEARLAAYYLQYAWKYQDKTAADFNALEAELENLQAGMEWCKERGMWEQVRDYARAAYWFLRTRAYWDRLMGWLQALKEACEKLRDRAGLARAYNNIAGIHYSRGAYEAALEWYEKSRKIGEEIGDRAGLAATYNNIGRIYDSRGAYDAALEWYEKSREIVEEIGDRAGLAATYNNIGRIYDSRGAYEAALEWYEKSVKIKEEIGDRAGLATTLHNLGYVALAQGRLNEALSFFTRSRDIYAEIGLEKNVAEEEEMIAKVGMMMQ